MGRVKGAIGRFGEEVAARHLAGAGLRIVDVLDGEHAGPPELADDCGFHVASRSSRAG